LVIAGAIGSGSWSGRSGQQTDQPAPLPAVPGVIPRRAGQRGFASRAGHRTALDAHAPEHLVLDEQQIPWIEEAIDREERIGHPCVTEMKGAVPGQEFGFGSGNHAEAPRANRQMIGEITPCGQRSPGTMVRRGPTRSVDSADEIG
jgi:hypothetical protein